MRVLNNRIIDPIPHKSFYINFAKSTTKLSKLPGTVEPLVKFMTFSLAVVVVVVVVVILVVVVVVAAVVLAVVAAVVVVVVVALEVELL